jgi:hypothetical protein
VYDLQRRISKKETRKKKVKKILIQTLIELVINASASFQMKTLQEEALGHISQHVKNVISTVSFKQEDQG